MNEPLHIMIGGEHGTIRTFSLTPKRLLITASLCTFSIFTLAAVCFFTVGSNLQTQFLVNKVSSLKQELKATKNHNIGLDDKVTTLTRDNEVQLSNLRLKNDLLISKIQLENSRQVADLEMKNLKQQTSFKEEREFLLSTAVNELNERNELFNAVMNSIGIKLKNKKNTSSRDNSGGPYIALQDKKYDELIYKADMYLDAIRTLPLGKPVAGSISSRYGSRIDPLNNKKAFHSGVDLRGNRGEKVRATADGKVAFSGRNGSFGNFVKINHGKGYTTSFAHLQSYSVRIGEKVLRGQVIGRVGNSGRSTGPHLHYEIAKYGKTVNPHNFIRLQ